MSYRFNGKSIYKVRPIINGIIRDDQEKLFVGTESEMLAHINYLDKKDKQQYAAKLIQHG